jgi:hypothetical protein
LGLLLSLLKDDDEADDEEEVEADEAVEAELFRGGGGA